MPTAEDYAIIDVAKGSTSNGKVLVLIDDETTARDIASELHRRGCQVIVEPATGRHEVSVSLVTPTVGT